MSILFVVHRGVWKPLPDYPTCYFIDFEFFWAQVAIAAVLKWNDVVMEDGCCGSAAEWEYFCHKCTLPRRGDR